MKTLITTNQVVELAFGGDERAHRELIAECDIVEAEERYIRPILGDRLFEELLLGSYEELVTEYVAPALAAWCRYVVEPLLASRCSLCGADYDESLSVIMHNLSNRASTLSHRLSRYLNAHADKFPEYNPKLNPLNRCFIYGNIVQVY